MESIPRQELFENPPLPKGMKCVQDRLNEVVFLDLQPFNSKTAEQRQQDFCNALPELTTHCQTMGDQFIKRLTVFSGGKRFTLFSFSSVRDIKTALLGKSKNDEQLFAAIKEQGGLAILSEQLAKNVEFRKTCLNNLDWIDSEVYEKHVQQWETEAKRLKQDYLSHVIFRDTDFLKALDDELAAFDGEELIDTLLASKKLWKEANVAELIRSNAALRKRFTGCLLERKNALQQ